MEGKNSKKFVPSIMEINFSNLMVKFIMNFIQKV